MQASVLLTKLRLELNWLTAHPFPGDGQACASHGSTDPSDFLLVVRAKDSAQPADPAEPPWLSSAPAPKRRRVLAPAVAVVAGEKGPKGACEKEREKGEVEAEVGEDSLGMDFWASGTVQLCRYLHLCWPGCLAQQSGDAASGRAGTPSPKRLPGASDKGSATTSSSSSGSGEQGSGAHGEAQPRLAFPRSSLELGAGVGACSVFFAKHCRPRAPPGPPQRRLIVVTDYSLPAVRLARLNARLHLLHNRSDSGGPPRSPASPTSSTTSRVVSALLDWRQPELQRATDCLARAPTTHAGTGGLGGQKAPCGGLSRLPKGWLPGERFDLLFGAELLYLSCLARPLFGAVTRWLRGPAGAGTEKKEGSGGGEGVFVLSHTLRFSVLLGQEGLPAFEPFDACLQAFLNLCQPLPDARAAPLPHPPEQPPPLFYRLLGQVPVESLPLPSPVSAPASHPPSAPSSTACSPPSPPSPPSTPLPSPASSSPPPLRPPPSSVCLYGFSFDAAKLCLLPVQRRHPP